MTFRNDQLFYAAIWWASGLDGALAYTDSVFKDYGMTPVALEPSTKRNKEHDDVPVTEQQFRTYFDALYEGLKNGVEKPERTGEPGHTHIALEQSFGTSSDLPMYPDFPYSDVIEMATAVSGISRHAHAKAHKVEIHDTGHLFVTKEVNGQYRFVEFDYPGSPLLDYMAKPTFTKDDMKDTKQVVWETFFRVVPLEEGQKYQSGWMSVANTRVFRENTARAGQALTLGHYESSVPLAELTDAEIIAGTEKITGSMAVDADEYTAGYASERSQSQVEATENPGIVRHLKGPVTVMDVTEKMSLFTGLSFVIAKPGDKIIIEQEGYSPRVIRKDSLDTGKVKFIPFNPEKPPGVKPPQP
ncbi:MAG: hypothetical protein K0R10_711 [Alphaproteobacteria bacterium]|jgi:hypothetical protein|nr:hypothetical protein [Alphaproteobacteria bacterium]